MMTTTPPILSTLPEQRHRLIERIFARQNEQGSWKITDPTLPIQLYLPKHTATYHTLVTLADLGCDPADPRLERPIQTMIRLMYRPEKGVFGITPQAYSNHEPSPCINGHILYILGYFGKGGLYEASTVIQHFAQYQRFDDGDFKTPRQYPYSGPTDHCYSRHTCYWGVTGLLKGLVYLPQETATPASESLKQKCIEFILRHEVCYSSHHPEQLIRGYIDKLRFPGMDDFMEILHMLGRAGVRDPRMGRAIQLLKSKRNPEGTWNLERPLSNSIVSIGKAGAPNGFVTERALEVLDGFYRG